MVYITWYIIYKFASVSDIRYRLPITLFYVLDSSLTQMILLLHTPVYGHGKSEMNIKNVIASCF